MHTLDIFCTVIDNYGDAGFALRLGRDLTFYGFLVRLYCDDLKTLKPIKTKEDSENQSLCVSAWPDENNLSYEPAETVIQAFSCRLPDKLKSLIKNKKSLVINLDYMTAELWPEDYHRLPSYSDGYESWFFFPGLTQKTGGLICEKTLRQKIRDYQFSGHEFSCKSVGKTLSEPGLKTASEVITGTLFSYKNDNLRFFLDFLCSGRHKFVFTVFKGLPLDNLNEVLKLPVKLKEGDEFQKDNITFKAVSMLSQSEYDYLLLRSYLNLVRGEDSIVRAMLIGKPFLWQIYPQKEDAHRAKLNAMYDRMTENIELKDEVEELRQLNLRYVGFNRGNLPFSFDEFMPRWQSVCRRWSEHLLSLGSLTENLISFIEEKLGKK